VCVSVCVWLQLYVCPVSFIMCLPYWRINVLIKKAQKHFKNKNKKTCFSNSYKNIKTFLHLWIRQ